MLSEDFDKKIKGSLDQYSSTYDESAWQKMEDLLDEHLPQKKDDRRKIFFMLFFVLLLGGGLFVFFGNRSHNQNLISEEKNQLNAAPKGKDADVSNIKKVNPGTVKENITTPPESTDQYSASTKKIPGTINPEQEKISNLNLSSNKKHAPSDKQGKNKMKPGNDETIIQQPLENKAVVKYPAGNDNVSKSADDKETTATSVDLEKAETEKQVTENTTIGKQEETKDAPPITPATSSKNKNQKGKKSFTNNLFVSVSAGADVSMVGTEAGQMKPVFGAGLGYMISDRFSVRTGFYVNRKVYTAGPEDYNPPPNFWAYYPNLKSIDANCLVYEIPVNLDYWFAKTKKENWFVSAGISSLLMKKEDYEYYFKPVNNPNYITYKRSFENKNQHYFSVLGLSGGYARKINSHITIQAEPYMKISLTGIGYGNVDLNSTGILFSAIIKPFSAKK